MRKIGVRIYIALNFIRCCPHLLLYCFHENKSIIQADSRRWLNILHKNHKLPFGLVYLMVFYPAFRNLFYVRIKSDNPFLNMLCRRMSTLTIVTTKIGEGLYIPHGYASSIGARSIGKNCSINNNVTIGTSGKDNRPIILDNVRINAGAVIFGNITIGNNVIIGANATVNSSIPDDCTVFPPPSRIMKWNRGTADKTTASSIDIDF